MAKLGLDGSDPAPLLAMPWERLVEGLEADDPVIAGRVYFGPVLDMTNLPRHPVLA
jgi:para-nitrobenzyl esterase